MSKISLKLVVAGRTYPLTVQEGEEKKVQKAADDINKSIKLLQDNYAVKDMQDLLAMTALQLATKSTASVQSNSVDYSEIEDSLQELLNKIDQ
ncbi:MAG: cell division protein ZapA [Flavobacteriia bacterium]|jgi:cell division protein ZapA (FtsZ GTPase activity inhibitor)